MKDNEFTIITCSYNTPIITECMLKSFFKFHKGIHPIIIVENSTDNASREMLDSYDIPFVDGKSVLPPMPSKSNWGWSHHAGLDWAVKKCTTPNCLIIDTDIIFLKNIDNFFDMFTKNSAAVAMGQFQPRLANDNNGNILPSKSGKVLPRLHPCFMLLDVHFFNEHDLIFGKHTDDDLRDGEGYDIGSYLYRRIYELDKETIHISLYDKSYIHVGGMSWEKGVNIDQNHTIYKRTIHKKLSDIDITGKFISGL